MTAAFDTELQKKEFQANIILDIDGTKFSQYTPDSGVAVDANKIGLILDSRINGVSIDLRDVRTPIAKMTFKMLDKDSVFTQFMMQDSSILQNKEVKMYFGFITGSFDFADYKLMATTRITSISRQANSYNLSSAEAPNLLKTVFLKTTSTLDGGISDVDSTLVLDDASLFPTSGRVFIGKEYMLYSGKSANSLTGLTRADLSSEADAHDDGDECFLVTTKEDHAINVMTDIILTDVGLDPALLNLTSFTDIRDGDLAGEGDFLLYIHDEADALEFIETNLCLATNTRLVTKDGKINLVLLDQVPIDSTIEIDEDHIDSDPTWNIVDRKIVNKIEVNWNYNWGGDKFSRQNIFTDSESITTYGERKPLKLNFKGVTAANGGASIVSDRASRLLARLSNPEVVIGVETKLNRLNINVGDNVRLTHRYIPQQGGSLGFSDICEILSKSPGTLAVNGKINFKLTFTSYTGIRFGLIAPSPLLSLTITDQSTFEVPDGACYKVGYKLRLWNNTTNVYFADPVGEIDSISGNFITMKTAWVTTLGPTVKLKFADFDEASPEQRARYAYIAPDSGFFSDGSKAYQIIL